MKTIDDALELRGRILGAFEMAAVEPDPDSQRAWLTFVVVGGGPTGVEIAGQIAELSRRVLPKDFRPIEPQSARVLLFEGGKEVLAGFGNRLSSKASKALTRQGVEIRTGTIVTNIDRGSVEVKGEDDEVQRVAARTKIWAAGVQASPLARMLGDATGAECDRAGRVAVQPDCSLPGTRRCSRSATWRCSTVCPAWPRSPCSRASTLRGRFCDAFVERARRRFATATSAAWRRSRASEQSSASRGSAWPGSGVADVAVRPSRFPDRIR